MSMVVIITDDDPVAVFLHRKIVIESELSSDPLGFLNAEETLNYLDNQPEDRTIFLILLDINMPGMDGWKLLDTISKQPYSDRIYVLMVSSSVDASDHEKAEAYKQVIGYLEKPIGVKTMQELQQSGRLSEVLRKQI